jgi:hypothetical protein
MKPILLVFVCFLSLSVKSQIITTIAGGGAVLGDGGLAVNAILNNPGGIVFDKFGNLYIAEGSGNRVRKISNTGLITTIAGTGISGYNGDGIPATNAKLHNPFGLDVDTLGNIYIADCGNYRVRKVDVNTGIISTVVGIGVSGYNGEGMQATTAMITQPNDICFDRHGNLYITDPANYRIRKVNTLGVISTFAGDGTSGNSGDGGPATLAKFTLIYGIKADKYDNIYVADWSDGKVRKINTTGEINTIAGTGLLTYNGDNIPAINANIVPIRLVLNSLGELFITDYTNFRIRKIDTFGVIHTVAGNGVSGYSGDGELAINAKLNGLNGLSVDSCDNVFVSSHFTRIRKIEFNSDCIPTSVKDENTNHNVSVKLYPNPTNREVTIEGKAISNVTVRNMMGQVVFEQAYKKSDKVMVDISHHPPGIYMVRVNNVWVGKVVKE